MRDCVFTDNSIALSADDSFVSRCEFRSNSSGITGGTLAVEDSWIVLNGVGIHSQFAHVRMRGCTIADNAQDGVVAQSLELRDSILWGNALDQVQCLLTATVEHCDVQGGPAGIVAGTLEYGAGNLAVDPLFVLPLTDYHLRATSPCIDAGDPAFVPFFLQRDGDRGPRRARVHVDMGADELP